MPEPATCRILVLVWLHPGMNPESAATNSLTDVEGILVGHSTLIEPGWLTGTTVVVAPDGGAVGGVDVRGGGPGTRETDLLDPRNQVTHVHAVVLTGGSAFGLAAADGVMDSLFAAGIGYPMGEPGEVVPIVPAAVIFDLGRGGDFSHHPDASTGADAYAAATAGPVTQGVVGAGAGAKAGGLKGGVGSASTALADGSTVAALVIVNSAGSTVDLSTGELYAARFALPGDAPHLRRPEAAELDAAKDAAGELGRVSGQLATTIGVVATDVALTKAQCSKVSGIAHDGLARAIRPVHTMFDGDTIFTLATGRRPAPDLLQFHQLLDAAGDCVSRAVLRAMLSAHSVDTPGEPPAGGRIRSYREAFPSAFSP
jgi:L-aminopeptidase/D-esterase-like protein